MNYTDEQLNMARNTDLIRLLEENGYILRKERNAYRVLNVDGGLYVFEKNLNYTQGFYWHKFDLKGDAIEFCKKFFNDNFENAIDRLLKVNNQSVHQWTPKNYQYKNNNCPPVDSDKNFVLPNRDNNVKQAYSYLVNTRKINKNLVEKCLKYGILRQFKEDNHVYVGFIGKNKLDEPKYLMLRSTLDKSSFKKEYENSNKKYGFKIFNKEQVSTSGHINIYIFESPIDLLSYMTLYPKKTLEKNAFLSMGGVSTLNLEQFIADYKPNIDTINVCFDNDEPGQLNAKKIKEKLSTSGQQVSILKPINKDFNEDLKDMVKKNNAINQNTEEITEGLYRAKSIN